MSIGVSGGTLLDLQAEGADITFNDGTGLSGLALRTDSGMTFYDNRATAVGVQYDSDYSSNFTNRSLVDKEYVTGLTSTIVVDVDADLAYLSGVTDQNTSDISSNNDDIVYLSGVTDGQAADISFLSGASDQNTTDITTITGLAITGATNGLTKSGQNVVLGGTVSSSINLNSSTGAQVLNIGGTTEFAAISMTTDSYVATTPTGVNQKSNVDFVASSLDIEHSDASANLARIRLDDTAIVITNNISTDGVLYAADYSAGFTARSLVDKGYVTGLTSAIESTGNDTEIIFNTGGTSLAGSSDFTFDGSFVTVPSLKVNDTPAAGTTNDKVIVWDSADKQLKTIEGSELGEDNNSYAVTAITSSATLTPVLYTVLVNGAAAVTVTLPASPADGQAYKIKDASGNALTNNVTISGNGNNIDGAGTAVINTDYGALELVYNASLDEWFTLAFIN